MSADLSKTHMEDVDVAVIGGGPGGLAAAACVHIADPSLRIKVRSWPSPVLQAYVQPIEGKTLSC